jgi:hypothetical protein
VNRDGSEDPRRIAVVSSSETRVDRLTERAEVADVNTSVVYEHIRRAVLEALDDTQRR